MNNDIKNNAFKNQQLPFYTETTNIAYYFKIVIPVKSVTCTELRISETKIIKSS